VLLFFCELCGVKVSFLDSGEIVAILEFRESLFFPKAPGEVMVVGDEYHVICVDCPEWSESIADYGEQSDKDVVNNVDEIGLASTNINPTCVKYCW
jgi:hypothetical protein